MRILCFLVLSLCTGLYSLAQPVDFNNYQLLKSEGKIPPDFLQSSRIKFEQSREQIDVKARKRDRRAQEDFLLTSAFAVDQLLLSGKILFNDPATVYLNKVMDEIMKAEDGDYKDDIKLHVLKSPIVNAFSTNQGYLFITTGLIAQLSTESELAFVLCHEVIHFRNKHAINSYVEQQRIIRGEGSYGMTAPEDRYLSRANYNKEQELEADLQGFELFKKTKYSKDAINNVFDVLLYSSLPFEEIPFDSTFVGNPNIHFPKDYWLDEVASVEVKDDYDDSKHSHPNIAKRRDALASSVSSMNNAGRTDYVVSQVEFETIRNICRFEDCHMALLNQDYIKAYYEAYCLLKEYPNSLYLKKIVLKSMYGMSMYANKRRLKKALPRWEKMQGEIQQPAHLFASMEAPELNVIALEYAWKLKTAHPDDMETAEITNHLFRQLVRYHYDDRTAFYTAPPAPVISAADTTVAVPADTVTEPAPPVKKGKYASIKKKVKKSQDNGYILYAFVDLLKDTAFVNTYDALTKEKMEEQKIAKRDALTSDAAKRSAAKLYSKHGFALGADKVLFLAPSYMKIDERKRNAVRLISGEKAEEELRRRVESIAATIGLEAIMIDGRSLSEDDAAEKMNDLLLLKSWIEEGMDHEKTRILATDREAIMKLSEKYQAQMVCLFGVYNIIEQKRPEYLILATTAAIVAPFYSWPFVIPYLVNREEVTVFYALVFNMETGDKEMVKYYDYENHDRPALINSVIYDVLYQVHSKDKGVHLRNEDINTLINENTISQVNEY